MSNQQRDELSRTIVEGASKAIAIDPSLIPALQARAQAYLESKRYREAITDYDRILALNPKDEAAFQDRASAKFEISDLHGAIDDFGKSIENAKRELHRSISYERRADAYAKTRQWDLAVGDLNTAISLQIGGVVAVSNVQQFRALYPEYKAASDEAIARRLRDTFYPNMQYTDFAKGFLRDNVARGFLPSTVIPDLYLKRSDVYLRAGRWPAAAIDFRRATDGFPDYASAIERWREIGSGGNDHTFLDMRTFNASHPESVRMWIKKSQGVQNANGAYSVRQYEINCTARLIRSLSFASYNTNGNITGASEGGKWDSIVPDSFGESLQIAVCQSK